MATGARVVAVGSGKGGAGTSTVAALLAATLAAGGRRVLLVDTSERLGTLHHLLGVPAGLPLGTLRRGAEPQALLSAVSPTLTLVSSAPDDTTLTPAERRALIERMTSLYAGFELVVLDAGASASSILDACAQGASRLLALGAGDRVGLAATYALIKLVHERFADVRIDVLANRSDDAAGEMLHRQLNAATVRFLDRTIPYAGAIPEDRDFGSALAAGLGAHDAAAGSVAAQAMQEIGERILADFETPPGISGTIRHFRKG
jgi:MinD-like ATPase involved in chromosome partitioning or flagellar assembly